MSRYDVFFEYCSQFVQFTATEKETIISHLVIRDVPKNYTLVDLGDVAREVYFINDGCMRYYYITDEGKDITGFVYLENMFAGSVESYFSQTESTQILETLSNCELLVLGYRSLHELFDLVPKMNILLRKLLQVRMAHAQRIIAALIINKPEQRYTAFTELHPGIEQKIPQHILASFMGITPVSLSRIRSRRLKVNRPEDSGD